MNYAFIQNARKGHFKPIAGFSKFQSWFKANHSTEMALLKVLNYILILIDSGSSVILVLLDLSTAFNTIDHDILVSLL